MAMKIKDLAKIKLDADSVLLVQLPDSCSVSTITSFKRTLKKLFPYNETLVYIGDIKWGTISSEDAFEKIVLNSKGNEDV